MRRHREEARHEELELTAYCTLGFNDVAALDDGSMWPTSYALTALTEADAQKIAELVQKAVG